MRWTVRARVSSAVDTVGGVVQLTSSSPGPVTSLLGLVVGLATVVLGVALVRDADSAFGMTWAAMSVVFGAVVLLSLITVLPAPSRPAPAARETVWEGQPARFHPHPAGRNQVVGMSVLTLLGAWFAVMGVVGAVEETKLWAVMAAAPAVYFLGFPVLGALGRFRSGGWWITPTRLVVEHRGLRSELPLREVATVTPRSESVHVAPAGPMAVTHRSLTPWPWRARARSEDLVIPTVGAPGSSEGCAALVREAAASATR